MSYGAKYEELAVLVKKRDNHTCRVCGWRPRNRNERRKLHADHIIPRERGGQDILANLLTKCWRCHLQKTVMGKSARKQRQMEKLFRANARPPKINKRPKSRWGKPISLTPYAQKW